MNDALMTVRGAVPAEALGLALPHEHIMSTFGAEPVRYPHYPMDDLLGAVLPYLQKVKALGCRAILDCTAAYFGRHPELLRDISVQSGLHILTNTGYYAAANDRYVPAHAHTESAEQIAERWTWEWTHGIDGTDIRPGFIKTAVDEGPLSEIDRKLLQAAVLTHRQTGLTIQTHTGDNPGAARDVLIMLQHSGVHPAAWVWVHAHAVKDISILLDAAAQGAWISLDGLNQDSAGHILSVMRAFQQRGLLQQVLLSHDGDLYCAGDFRPFDYLLTAFLPSLADKGFSQDEIELVTRSNPARAFVVQRRLL